MEPEFDDDDQQSADLSDEEAREAERERRKEERMHDNDLKAMNTRLGKFKVCFMTSGGKSNEGCLIYIALSKSKKESISHLRK